MLDLGNDDEDNSGADSDGDGDDEAVKEVGAFDPDKASDAEVQARSQDLVKQALKKLRSGRKVQGKDSKWGDEDMLWAVTAAYDKDVYGAGFGDIASRWAEAHREYQLTGRPDPDHPGTAPASEVALLVSDSRFRQRIQGAVNIYMQIPSLMQWDTGTGRVKGLTDKQHQVCNTLMELAKSCKTNGVGGSKRAATPVKREREALLEAIDDKLEQKGTTLPGSNKKKKAQQKLAAQNNANDANRDAREAAMRRLGLDSANNYSDQRLLLAEKQEFERERYKAELADRKEERLWIERREKAEREERMAKEIADREERMADREERMADRKERLARETSEQESRQKRDDMLFRVLMTKFLEMEKKETDDKTT